APRDWELFWGEMSLPSAQPLCSQMPVTFEDIVVHFSRKEWEMLDEEQKELYRTVMEDNYEMLMSLYCDLSKPGLLSWIGEGGDLWETPVKSHLEAADLSLEPTTGVPVLFSSPEPPSDDGLLEMKTKESPEENCGGLEESRSVVVPPTCSAYVPHEATAVPADPSQPTPSPSCPLSTGSREAVDLKESPSPPPAAADAEVEIPMEVPQEEVAADEPAVPETPSKGQKEEDVKDSGKSGQAPVADIPKELGKTTIPDVCTVTGQAEPSSAGAELGEPGKDPFASRTAACQRNSTREKFYSCPICRKTFLLKINLVIHQWSHNKWQAYICTHCDRSFMSKKKIRRHLRARTLKGVCQPLEEEERASRAPCPAPQPLAPSRDCGTAWGKPSPSRFPLAPGNVTYTCKECMENFSSESFLILHQHRHGNHHVIRCPSCNRTFTWASDFVRHHRTHTGERPYRCDTCQKAFKRLHHLSVHRRIHDDRQNRPYPCRSQLPAPAPHV
ncbi:ZN879 protein, partial [Thinocorus orbignyianus]|nr:ZN879 protein [Thinocorus orbignyianus]